MRLSPLVSEGGEVDRSARPGASWTPVVWFWSCSVICVSCCVSVTVLFSLFHLYHCDDDGNVCHEPVMVMVTVGMRFVSKSGLF